MRTIYFASLVAASVFVTSAPAVITTFNYAQTDSTTGSGSVAAFSYDNGGGPINFTSTPLPSATVINPAPGTTPAGFVGGITGTSGNSNETNQGLGIGWSGFVTANGTRGASAFTMQIPLIYIAKQTQAPDVNDFHWSVVYGDSLASGVDAASTSLRFAFYMSRDDVIDAAETIDTFQRYTQLNHTFVSGVQDSFTNTDTTTAPLKDATDSGAPAGNDAAGRNLAFYWAWRDQGSLTSGAILVDSFAVDGLINADESTLTQVPEPSSALLAAGALGLLLRRRR